MSSNASRTLPLELKADMIVIAAIAAIGLAAAAGTVLAPFGSALRAALVLLILTICSQAAAQQCFGGRRHARRSLSLAGAGHWRLEFAGAWPCETGHVLSSMRIGRWWFVRWPEGWAVLSPRVVGERDWRRLSALLRDRSRAGAWARTASR